MYQKDKPRWTDEDRFVAVGFACIAELRGRSYLIQPILEQPSVILKDANAIKRLPFPLQARLKDSAWKKTAERVLEKTRKKGWTPVGYGDPEFPDSLRHIKNPPPVLWCDGTIPDGSKPILAVVGSRRCSGYGRNALYFLLNPLADYPIVIVSGLAVGIDGLAHQWALEHHNPTVAVVGHGLAHTYPVEHIKLRESIVTAGGAILTEYPPDTPPRREHFPQRNRLISGLADVVLIVEAPIRSGALNTAHWAIDQGREVLAVPGSILRETSAGTNFLIRKGLASPALIPEHLIEAFPEWKSPTRFRPPREKNNTIDQPLGETNPLHRAILGILSADEPCSIDEILDRCSSGNFHLDDIYQSLFDLELRGLIISLPGRKYLRKV